MKTKISEEIHHFSNLPHIWWGARTRAGQKRYDNKLALLLQLYDLSRPVKILEIGCGDGEFTKRIVRNIGRNSRIIATDITPTVIKRAYASIKDARVSFLVDNAESMRFGPQTFDIVCGISILHHINLMKALREIYRVLKKGGVIFFTEPNFLNPHIFLGLHIPYLRRIMEFSRHEKAFIRWQLERSISDAGFVNVSVANYDFLHPSTPQPLIGFVERFGKILEHTPFFKEFSGSLSVVARKQV